MVGAYGAQLAVSAPDGEILRRIIDGLPPGWELCPPEIQHDEVSWRIAVLREEDGYRLRDSDGYERTSADLELTICMMRTQMRRYVGHHASDLVFIHAGVVAHRGRAILIPGPSFAGKSTLVAALVRAGADYYSDEFAMLDAQGLVAQYREPLSIRGPEGREEVAVGPATTQRPIPVGAAAITMYKPGSTWQPRHLSTAAGVLAMMEHAVPARERPAETLATLRQALQGAVIFEGDRGEADETAVALLEAVAGLQD